MRNVEFEQQLKSLSYGDHLCMVYENRDEQLAAAIPFLRHGLAVGDCCAYIADDQTIDQLIQALVHAGVDVEREQELGALRLLTKRESYLASGSFDPLAMVEFLRTTVDEALRAGFSGFRITGEMTWALGQESGCERLIEYEALLNCFFPGSRALAICQYNRQRFSPAIIKDVLRTHPLALLGDQICDNLYYEPPEFILTGGHVAEQVQWMIEQLKRSERRAAERKHAHLEREQVLSTLNSLVASAPVGIALLDKQMRFRLVNKPLAEINGLAEERHIGKTVSEVVPDLFAQAEPVFRTVLESGIPITNQVLEGETGSAPGVRRIWQESWFPVFGANSKPSGVGVIVQEITEQRRGEEALREGERRLRFVLDSMPQKIFTATPEGDIDYFNPQWTEFTGLSFEQIRGWGWTQFIHPDDVGENVRIWQYSIHTGESFQFQHRFRRADGQYRWHLSRALPMRNDQGRIVMWIGSNTDIHDAKQAEEAAVLRSEQVKQLADVATRLNVALDVPSVATIVTEEARKLIAAHQSVTSTTVDHNWAQAINAVSLSDKYSAWRTYDAPPDGSGIYTLVCMTNRPMRLTQEELEAHPAWKSFGSQAQQHPPLRGWLAAPLVGRDGRNIGLIQLSDKYDGDFTEDDEPVLVQLAQMASIAIENARLVESLRDSDRRKDEFLAVLAHELRNPLAPIRSALELFRLAGDNRAVIDQARTMMDRQVNQMVRLIDDLLDVSRITRGKLELRKEWISLADVIQSAIETSRPLIESSGHELAVTFPAEPIYLAADQTRLAQVFSNLLNNAAKYTHRGGRISLTVERPGAFAIVRVRDNGIGIPSDMLSKIFEMFAQVDRSLEKTYGGLGIGLTLVKRLVEMHGGSVEAHSQGVGEGSELVVSLPVPVQPLQQPTRTASSDRFTLPLKRRILIADDNQDSADALAMMLQFAGHEVRTAYDGAEALDAAAAFRPDVLLLDIGMPKLNGYDVARRIREQPWGDRILLIAMTGWGQQDVKLQASAAGFDHHLIKPVMRERLEYLLSSAPTLDGN